MVADTQLLGCSMMVLKAVSKLVGRSEKIGCPSKFTRLTTRETAAHRMRCRPIVFRLFEPARRHAMRRMSLSASG